MPRVLRRVRERCRSLATVMRQVAGAPDYQRYVAHVRACHPGVEPARWDDFYLTRLNERYNKPGAKCC
jgi:uncharacterized short protein YbdD (DUF466 family)